MAQQTCAACPDPVPHSKLCRVVLDGRVIALCRTHAARVAAARPESFDEMRALFKEIPTDDSPFGRRSVIDRRMADDRRVFPPRPEGRRLVPGRRRTDQPQQ
ncbi:MAG: hypothetical protein U0414_35625 [Polyangiaceae bacterium]